MPCPYLSGASGECLLQQEPESEADDVRQPAVSDEVRHEWCLSSPPRFRDCPILQRSVAELVA